jgi:hypothetical protein
MAHGMEFLLFRKTLLVGVTLAGSALLLGAPHSRADEEDCQKRVVRIDHELHKAAEKHGWDSPQAKEKRRALVAAREWCWEHGHRWWDEDAQRWHTERDWDEHDHDRDRPHDRDPH